MKKKNKQILFADGATRSVLVNVLGGEEAPKPPAYEAFDGMTEVKLADELARRVNAWAERGDIEPTQLTLFLKRVKQEPAVTDVKLDGNVLVLAIADGSVERINPDAGVDLSEVIVKDRLTWYEKAWFWIKDHKAVSIASGSALLALVVVLIIKHARS